MFKQSSKLGINSIDLLFEQNNFSLNDLILSYRTRKQYFAEGELWYFIKQSLKYIELFEKHQDILNSNQLCIFESHVNHQGQIQFYNLILSTQKQHQNMIRDEKIRIFDSHPLDNKNTMIYRQLGFTILKMIDVTNFSKQKAQISEEYYCQIECMRIQLPNQGKFIRDILTSLQRPFLMTKIQMPLAYQQNQKIFKIIPYPYQIALSNYLIQHQKREIIISNLKS